MNFLGHFLGIWKQTGGATELHTLVIHEPHPTRPGVFSRYYAIIETSHDEAGWRWKQRALDIGDVTGWSEPFESMHHAAMNALVKLGGDGYERSTYGLPVAPSRADRQEL